MPSKVSAKNTWPRIKPYGGGRPTNQGPNAKGTGAPTAKVGRNKARETLSQHQLPSNGHTKDHHNNDNDNAPPSSKPHIEKSETMSKATGAAANAQAVNRRRSNVVKEVEKLKENREKRRAQQAQIGRDTSELQSRSDLVCRLLLEKKKRTNQRNTSSQPLHTSDIV